MTFRNGEKTACITLFADEAPVWSNEVVAYLGEHGYDLNRATSVEGSWNNAIKSIPDVVMTLNTADSLHCARELERHWTASHRPLLLRIADDLAEDLADECADVILPPAPEYLERQLRMFLKLRDDNARLRRRVHTLEAEATLLSAKLEKQNQLSIEVEILKNAIVRNISHELRTPLLQVKSAVALIAEDVQDEELVNYAKGATGRLETLVKNVTLLGSSLDVNPAPIIVRESVAYAIRNLGRIWEHRDDVERIHTELEPNLPPVLADKQGLSTVLQLLMDNALKFSKDAIEVSAHRVNDRVCISISDHGIGIAQDHLDSIFEVFYQIDASSKRRYGGTGIGLAIVRLILDRHESWIEVESQVGKGSTFSFLLPAVAL